MAVTAVERKYPWFLPMTRHKYLGEPRPTKAEFPSLPVHVTKQTAPEVVAEWAKYDAWRPWSRSGRKPPRPAGIWAKVPDWAWLIDRDRWRMDHAPSPNPPLPPGPQPPHFKMVPSLTKNKPGIYYYTYVNAAPGEGRVPQLLAQNGMWAALLVHELARAPYPSYDTQEQRKALQHAGVPVIASGWVESDGDLAAQAHAAAQYSAGFDEYMLNAEDSWALYGSHGQHGFEQMGEFARLLREALGPDMPISLSCMWGQITWLKPLLEAGLSCVRPQCYTNQYSHMVPGPWAPEGDNLGAVGRLAWSQADLPGGIPPSMVDPTYGTYGGYLMSMNAVKPQHAAAKKAGVRSGSVWAGEFVPEADYPVIASF